MAFDLTSGSVLFNFQSPASGSVTDFSVIANIERSSFASEADATAFYALWTSTDVTRCRFCKADQLTELAFDIIDYDLTTGSEYVIVRILYSGTISSTGSYSFYFMPALSTNTAYSASDTYGQYNAYGSDDARYAHDGGITDRTSNQNGGIGYGGISSGTSNGIIGSGTEFDGNDAIGFVSNIFSEASEGCIIGAFYVDGLASESQNLYSGGNWASRLYPVLQTDGTIRFRLDSTDIYTTNLYSVGWNVYGVSWQAGEINCFLNGTFTTSTDTVLPGNTEAEGVGAYFSSFTSPLNSYFVGAQSDTRSITAYKSQDFILYEYSQISDNSGFLGTGTYNAPSGGTTYVDGALDLLQGNSITLNGQLIKLGSFNVEQFSTLEVNGDMYSYVDAALDIGQYSALEINGSTAEFLDGSLSINQGSSVVLNGQRVLTGSLSIGQGSSLEVKPVVLLQSSLNIEQGSTVVLAGSTDVASEQKPVKLDAFYFKWCGRRCL